MAVEETVKTVKTVKTVSAIATVATVATVAIVVTVATRVNALLERRLQACVAWTSQLEMSWRCDDNDRNGSR